MDHTLKYLIILCCLALVGCTEDDSVSSQSCADLVAANDCSIASQNQCVHEIMLENYLWNDQVPTQINYQDFSSPRETLDFLRFDDPGPDSRFSYVDTAKSFESLYDQGQYVGFGFSFIADADGQLWVRFVYTDSAAGRAGMQRGDRIITINDQDVQQLTANPGWSSIFGGEEDIGLALELELARKGVDNFTINLEKGVASINTVLHSSIINQGGYRIGYLVYTSFLDVSRAELDEVFAQFNEAGVSKVILDLRYNGGGSVAVSNYLASYFNPGPASGRLFNRIQFNVNNQELNTDFYLETELPSLQLEQLIVITSSRTCSASEMIINGLRPFLDVKTIGSATCGKPVGQNPFFFCGTALLPVTFEIVNSRDEGEYFDGIAADCALVDNGGAFADDYQTALGDTSASVLGAAVNFAVNGECSATKPAKNRSSARVPEFENELGAVIGAI